MRERMEKWMTKKEALQDVLEYRGEIYNESYDLKFTTDWLQSKEETFNDFINSFNKNHIWKGVWVA